MGVGDFNRVVTTHKEYIQLTTKGPLFYKTADRNLGGAVGEDSQKVCVRCEAHCP